MELYTEYRVLWGQLLSEGMETAMPPPNPVEPDEQPVSDQETWVRCSVLEWQVTKRGVAQLCGPEGK